MVVRLLRPDLPLVHRPASPLGTDPVLRRQMFRQQAVLLRHRLEQRQTVRIPLRYHQPCMDKAPPEVDAEQHMPDGSLVDRHGDPPVQTDAFPGFPLVFRKRTTGNSHEATVRRKQGP